MSAPPDAVVVGGGIAGLCVALAAADRGLRVTVVDERRPGAASRASAGLLGASIGFAPDVARHAAAARDRYPSFVGALRDASGIDVPLDRRGIVEIVDSPRDHAPAGSERLDGAHLAALDARLSRHAHAILHPRDGAVDNARLMDALVIAADRHPRIALLAGAIVSLQRRGATIGAVLADGVSVTASRVVLAGGAWGGQIAGLPRAVPVHPLRGELLLLDAEPPARVIHGDGGYLVERDGGVLVGATSDDDGFVARTTDRGHDALLRVAERLAGLGAAPVRRHWAGLRPMSPDGLPILGQDTRWPELHHAGGMSRNGILFAPWAADHLALELAGGRAPALDPFRPSRLDRA